MSTLFDVMLAFFQEDGWNPVQMGDDPVLRMGFNGDNGQWTCYAQAREEQYQCVFYSLCPIKTSEAHRTAMAEFITRANYGLIVGNFELDFNDGEIRFKTSLDVEGTELNAALVKNVSYANVMAMDRYLPGIMAVASGYAAPIQAIEQIEGV